MLLLVFSGAGDDCGGVVPAVPRTTISKLAAVGGLFSFRRSADGRTGCGGGRAATAAAAVAAFVPIRRNM